MKIKTNKIFNILSKSDKRITLLQGSSRSGKTYNYLIWLVFAILLQNTGLTCSIVRESMNSLRSTAMRDFFTILQDANLYDRSNHNKTNNEYRLNENLIEFFSLDDSQKIRGRKRDYLFINEANECEYETFKQLMFRTTKKAVLDFNPSDDDFFGYDLPTSRDDTDLYITTYRDNPFLEKSIIKEIELLEQSDPYLWSVYGLGQRAKREGVIYQNWNTYDVLPSNIFTRCYGIDFGDVHPTCLVEVNFCDSEKGYATYTKEHIYQSYLTINDLIQLMNELNIDKNTELYCDSARSEYIRMLNEAGYNAIGAKKDVKEGINAVKQTQIYIDKKSTNLIKEIKNYSYKKRGEIVFDEPIKFKDDAMDAMRYAIYNHLLIFSQSIYF